MIPTTTALLSTTSVARRYLLSTTGRHAFAATTPAVSSTVPLHNGRNEDEKRQPQPRFYHASRAAGQSDVAAVVPTAAAKSGLMSRFITMTEVTVSKIFPAGFGWQTASIVAANQCGYAPDTMSFALSTGLGDAVGVFGGHMLYYSLKKSVTGNPKINLTAEMHTGILLGSAAFCSGTVWQPVVNALQGANLPFMQVMGGTWIACASAFYVGLRAGRTLLSGSLKHVVEPTYDNSKNDLSLSIAIGGATGFFVGTDAAYLPEQNFLLPVVGIVDGTPDIVGCAIAGTSTSMGFVATQSTFNMIYPTGKLWND
jgi:hypothetical protein